MKNKKIFFKKIILTVIQIIFYYSIFLLFVLMPILVGIEY